MKRYADMFASLEGGGAFGAFVMLGDPDLETSADILDALVEGGADMLEVGIPFSDPVADGPVIQAAAERALREQVTPADCLRLLTAARERHPQIPIGILTYANIVAARGRHHFYRAAAEAGVDSILLADVPALEAEPYAQAAREVGIAPVLIAAPSTPAAALERIARLGAGYTYCVTRAGVTGVDREVRLEHGRLFSHLGALGAAPPILGFGISAPEHVQAALRAGAAGVISGSAIVRLIASNPADPAAAVRGFVATMKESMRLQPA